jgi:malate/lactate dehydrogenase
VAFLEGEYGHRGVAVTVPARLIGGRIERILEVALEPRDRVAFDVAVDRRRAAS